MTMISLPVSSSIRRPPAALAWTACILTIAMMAVLRLRILPDTVLPIAYGVPLILNLWLRDRRCLWVMTAGFCLIVIAKYTIFVSANLFPNDADRLVAMLIILLDTIIIAGVLHAFIGSRDNLEQNILSLYAANEDLSK